MSKIGEFLDSIAHSPRIKAALATAGILAVLVTAQSATAQDVLANRKTMAVEDIYQAAAINERINDQLGQLKSMSDALGHSYGFSGNDIANKQKAANIKLAYEFAMQNISHPELAATDAYFLSPRGGDNLGELIDAVNRKKNTLLKATYFLQQVQQAYVYGRKDLAAEYTEKLAQVADQIEQAIMHDISAPAGEEDFTAQSVEFSGRAKIEVTIDRQRIDVEPDRETATFRM